MVYRNFRIFKRNSNQHHTYHTTSRSLTKSSAVRNPSSTRGSYTGMQPAEVYYLSDLGRRQNSVSGLLLVLSSVRPSVCPFVCWSKMGFDQLNILSPGGRCEHRENIGWPNNCMRQLLHGPTASIIIADDLCVC